MGAWYLNLTTSLVLILIGIYVHWSVVALGLALPFWPMISHLRAQRARRRSGERKDSTG